MPNPTIEREDFCPDFRWDIPNERRKFWAPAHPSNRTPQTSNFYGGARVIMGACIHTPEERADAIESTPWWFQQPQSNASTDFYGDNDGDLFQMVELADFSWAQGQTAGNTRLPRPAYLPAKGSYNRFYVSYEVEGFAESIVRTITPAQYETLVEWNAQMALHFQYAITRQRIVGHQELVTNRSDPGALLTPDFIRDVQERARVIEEGTTPPPTATPDHHHHLKGIPKWKTSAQIAGGP